MTHLSTRRHRLAWLLTGKTLLALTGIVTVTLGLVTYSATLNLTISPFFKEGLNTVSWRMTTSSGSRYLPGNNTLPSTPTDPPTTSFAFETQTGGGWVKVRASTPAPLATDFLSFRIFVLTWNSSQWLNATLYTSATFAAQVSGGIDGTNSSSVGYLHVLAGGAQVFFAVQVSYSLAPAPVDSTTSVVFEYTPNLN